MWLCVSTSPGMMILPAASIFLASGGISTSASGPTATILPLATTSVPLSISGPSIGMILAPTNASG